MWNDIWKSKRGRPSDVARTAGIVALVVFITLGVVMIWKLVLRDTPITPESRRVAGQEPAVKPPPPPPTPRLPVEPISIAGAALKGTASAPVAIVEYSDFECPYCATFVRTTFPDLDREYIATGRVLFAFRHLPLETIHKRAFRAAEASECANR
jgi:protein-disulfide isomerase